MMKILLLIGVLILPFALGDQVKCYESVDCKQPCRAIPRREVFCSSPCLKIDFVMNDGSLAIVRKCGAAYLGHQGPVLSLFNSTSYAPGAKAVPEITTGHVHLCKKNLCNGANSIISTSMLLTIVTIIVASVGINKNIF